MLLKYPFVVFAVSSLLVGCAVGPDYTPPELGVADHFYGQNLAGNESDRAEFIEWWKQFDDEQLTRFITIALEQNLDLAQATARVTQAQAGLGATNAALLPSANISGQTARAYQSVETPIGQVLNTVPGFDRNGNNYEINLNAGWELDLFGGLRREREAALAQYQASSASVAATRLAIVAQTADIYISIRGLQSRLDIARKQVSTQKEKLRLIELLFQKGVVAEHQVHQAQASVAQAQSFLPALEAGLETAMNSMDVILGVTPGTFRDELVTVTKIPPTPAITSMGSPRELLLRRPDLIIAEQHLIASNAMVGASMAEYYPKFSLNGLLGSATSISGGNLFTGDANQAAGVLGLRWRLFDFGRINAQIDQAEGREAEMLAAYRLAVLRATEDVESAFINLTKREQQTAALTESVDELSQARNSSFTAYEKGTASMLDVLALDEELLQASDGQTVTQYETAKAAVAAFKALGGGWQANAEKL